MSMSMADGESRIIDLMEQVSIILAKQDHEWAFQHDQKILIGVMVNALKPPPFKESIEAALMLTQNKLYKKDLLEFSWWLRTAARSFQPFASAYGDSDGKGDKEDKTKTDTRGDRSKGNGHGGRGNGSGNGGRGAGNANGGRGNGNANRSETKDTTRADGSVRKCIKCKKSDHGVFQCLQVKDKEEAKELMKKFRENGFKLESLNSTFPPDPKGRSAASILVENTISVPEATVDSGNQVPGVATAGLLAALVEAGVPTHLVELAKPVTMTPYGEDSEPITITHEVVFRSLEVQTRAGPMVWRGLRCWVDPTSTDVNLVIGLPVMALMGYDVQDLLAQAYEQNPDWDLSGTRGDSGTSTPDSPTESPQQKFDVFRLRRPDVDDQEQAPELDGLECATPTLKEHDPAEVYEVLKAIYDKLEEKGVLSTPALQRFYHLLMERFSDCFRLGFCPTDPPVAVEPLRVRIKEGAQPVKCGNRRYAPNHAKFMEHHRAELVKFGLGYVNNRSRRVSAPHCISKKVPADLLATMDPLEAVFAATRMTIDSRPINTWTEPMHWPMPNLDASTVVIAGAKYFFNLDWFKGYWQLALRPDSQEYYSFMTPYGVITPTRVLMGQTDAVAYCQSVGQEILGDLIGKNMLIWLDDMLGFASTEDGLLDVLEKVLILCEQYGLKLNPSKCDFFALEVTWCGKTISANGINHCPSRIQGLVDLKPPMTVADVQQFVCAANWLRTHVPNFTELVAPLTQFVTVGSKLAKNSRKKSALAKVTIQAAGWSQTHDECFARVKAALQAVVPLAFSVRC